jgi:hypothetical protein
MSALPSPQTQRRDIPAWEGGGLLSNFVNALIASPLYPIMKMAARSTLISTAENNGIAWREIVKDAEIDFSEDERRDALERITDKNLAAKYPEYYMKVRDV